MNRRTFYKVLGVTAFLPTILKTKDLLNVANFQEEMLVDFIPSELSGRVLSDDEKQWLKKFLIDYNKSITKLRNTDLPVDLFPGFIPKHPEKTSRRKKVIDED